MARASNIYEYKKNGKTHYYIMIDLGKDKNNKRKQKKKMGFKSVKEAKQALIEYQNELKKDQYIEPSKQIFDEYFKEWIRTEKEGTVKDVTLRDYKNIGENILSHYIGSVPLGSLTREHIVNMVSNLNSYSAKYIRKIVSVLNDALKHASEQEIISKNVASNVPIPRIQQKEFQVWNADQVAKFLNDSKDMTYHVLYRTLLMTGMRIGEALGLRWKDINKTTSGYLLSIRQTVNNYGVLETGGKTKSSMRSVEIDTETADYIFTLKETIQKNKEKFKDSYIDQDLIFCTRHGNVLQQPNIRFAYRKDMESIDLPRIRIHDFRHTHATLLLERKINPKVVSERLGHSSVVITLTTYAHVLPTMQTEAVSTLSSLFKER
ncbi:site-specific integrase [Bacillus safensis]|uniref:tyrosine-type recombinase/integrase n=1 Tax=Bacillus safensis TaxID=561879 RepID=UPI00203F64BD|nr:site-specific integrase [Bacillus safensis]MCM3367887.1 site-specific integrase [Bacillus safensis]